MYASGGKGTQIQRGTRLRESNTLRPQPAPETEQEMMVEVFKYTERVVNMIRPRKVLYMAIGTSRLCSVRRDVLRVLVQMVLHPEPR